MTIKQRIPLYNMINQPRLTMLFYLAIKKCKFVAVILLLSLYILFNNYSYTKQYLSLYADQYEGAYLVWNSKCHMPSKNPFDPSIIKFFNKETYEKCTNSLLLTWIISNANGTNTLMLNINETKKYKSLLCCWAPIVRPTPDKLNPQKDIDSTITVKNCIDFNRTVLLPKEVEVLTVKCYNANVDKKKFRKHKRVSIYENVHSVLNVEKVAERMKIPKIGNEGNQTRKLSVLLVGIDNISKLNFKRSLPKTKNYLKKKEWIDIEGYNKMGENTFPNVMAILTGKGLDEVNHKCKPTVPFGLDHCPMLWYNFRNAGYITAYAEDASVVPTFNYLKVGFVDPPTDYYLRPYVLACQKLLNTQKKFGNEYCLGPEVTVERIFNSGIDFAKRFKGHPYFGFFWSNSISHQSLNGLSSMDSRILLKLENLEKEGIMNDSMIIFLSDHGMRIGEFRKTLIGWYEERLPFLYIWLPEWFRKEDPAAYQALTVNQNRLTSPFDLYETLRDILIRAGGRAEPSSACPKCGSLFKTVDRERGCEDAGILPHWCTCNEVEKVEDSNEIAIQGAHKIVEHMDNIVKDFRTDDGRRLCSKLALKQIFEIKKVVELMKTSGEKYYFTIEVTPGGARYEATIVYFNSSNYSISTNEISRMDFYGDTAWCINTLAKVFCHCT